MDTYLGEIKMFGGNFAPRGFALCNGQLLSISQNTALFSLLGTTYGGDGIQTFGLPDLRGRAPIHWGNGIGLTPRVIGEESGSEAVTLLQSEMPAHNHLINASTTVATQVLPTNFILAQSTDAGVGGTPSNFIEASSANTTMAPNALSISGSSLPHDNMQPYLTINFIIALTGVYPSRN
ncbi:microcystin-dependent protein [Mucilaginibacter frigoritolerans]|jgi:microcystin-dependent protein|uniref:Microcystin-dependent protein n=1 Tax=Mucilaginibacter frigoritolerans TaxID=652788 RepID=A0A562TWN8_9SPHI|nr:tail fiber protein [Mucilaginibacter frigoritolerans]TWI97504.1 microcystin-dependent protein [Mucilaginibacter frigoritolerans]